MAVIPLLKVTIFVLMTLLSLFVLGVCVHIEYQIHGYQNVYSFFAPFALGVACLTVPSLPLFLVLEKFRRRVFTSTVLFEIVWFFVLWILWAGTAGDTSTVKAYHFPGGCTSDDNPEADRLCYEITVVEAFAFSNFFCAFIYFDVIFLYAIINAIHGKAVWTTSVKESTTSTPFAIDPGVPMVRPQFNTLAAVQHQNYDVYPSKVPPSQQYNAHPQQVPCHGFSQPLRVLTQSVPTQFYPQQVYSQSAPQQYNAYAQQAPQTPTVPPGQNQPHTYPPSPSTLQPQVNYGGYTLSPTSTCTTLPPPNYDAYVVDGSQAHLPLPSGYQGLMIPEKPLRSSIIHGEGSLVSCSRG